MAQRSVERDHKIRSYGQFCKQKFGNHSFRLVLQKELRGSAELAEAGDEGLAIGAKKSGEKQLDDPKRGNENSAKSDRTKFHETRPV